MTTPLIFAAPRILEKTTGYYFYPHLITFDATKKRWKFTEPKNNYKPSIFLFYYVNIIHLVVVTVGCLLLQILKYCLFKHKAIHGALIVFYVGLSFISIFGWGYNIPTIKYGYYMVDYVNALLDYEKRLKIKQNPVFKYSKSMNMSPGHLSIFQSELEYKSRVKYWTDLKCSPCYFFLGIVVTYQGLETDLLGIFLNLLVVYLQPFAFLFPVCAVIFKLDPFYYCFRDVGLLSYLYFPVHCFIRYIFCVITLIESVRTIILFLIPILIVYKVTHKLILILQSFKINEETLADYHQLYIIHHYGNWMLKYSISIYLWCGYILAILFNCFTIVGWKIFPMTLYLLSVPITFSIHFLIHVALPLCVRSHESSYYLIRYTWPRNLPSFKNQFERKLLQKRLKSLQTITFYSGSVASLDKATRLSFIQFNTINTVDVLLLIQNTLAEMDKVVF